MVASIDVRSSIQEPGHRARRTEVIPKRPLSLPNDRAWLGAFI